MRTQPEAEFDSPNNESTKKVNTNPENRSGVLLCGSYDGEGNGRSVASSTVDAPHRW